MDGASSSVVGAEGAFNLTATSPLYGMSFYLRNLSMPVTMRTINGQDNLCQIFDCFVMLKAKRNLFATS
jgi:hypothetical protein